MYAQNYLFLTPPRTLYYYPLLYVHFSIYPSLLPRQRKKGTFTNVITHWGVDDTKRKHDFFYISSLLT